MDYLFKCPSCKTVADVHIMRTSITPAYVEDIGSGPELYEHEDEITHLLSFSCGECGWKLPCKTYNDVVDYVVDQEVERRT